LTLYIREGVGGKSSRKPLFIGGREVAAEQQRPAVYRSITKTQSDRGKKIAVKAGKKEKSGWV
jgi:hypothetical protein